ncbi:hypothetical protein JAAARDRAFT_42334 [Jaapia argillacea MUCL 33604]|uniref:Uncharacterized protein n=1 Tax=Jaapia argillacea MUCL 33604 TaxID=933084 RepID=A0A067P8K6_9AGAM|nr:hypothetical protein JAAARDRAFT_42334 [Jaapia argillacea MUCL 33604]
MKSCLKHSPPQSPVMQPSTPRQIHTPPPLNMHHKRKSVTWCAEELQQVFIADEWDRTPAEVARNLSYEDVLELKQLQLSLPRAQQKPDPHSRLPQYELCSGIPVGLLPLLPETSPSPSNYYGSYGANSDSYFSSTSSSTYSSASSSPAFRPIDSFKPVDSVNPSPRPSPPPSRLANRFPILPLTSHYTPSPPPTPPPSQQTQPRLSTTMPSKPNRWVELTAPKRSAHPLASTKYQAPRPKSKFAFLPLLDPSPLSTPPSEPEPEPELGAGSEGTETEGSEREQGGCGGAGSTTPSSTPSLTTCSLSPSPSPSSSASTSPSSSPITGLAHDDEEGGASGYFDLEPSSHQIPQSNSNFDSNFSTDDVPLDMIPSSSPYPYPYSSYPTLGLGALATKGRLAAIPSPVLAPPSPFSLEGVAAVLAKKESRICERDVERIRGAMLFVPVNSNAHGDEDDGEDVLRANFTRGGYGVARTRPLVTTPPPPSGPTLGEKEVDEQGVPLFAFERHRSSVVGFGEGEEGGEHPLGYEKASELRSPSPILRPFCLVERERVGES